MASKHRLPVQASTGQNSCRHGRLPLQASTGQSKLPLQARTGQNRLPLQGSTGQNSCRLLQRPPPLMAFPATPPNKPTLKVLMCTKVHVFFSFLCSHLAPTLELLQPCLPEEMASAATPPLGFFSHPHPNKQALLAFSAPPPRSKHLSSIFACATCGRSHDGSMCAEVSVVFCLCELPALALCEI